MSKRQQVRKKHDGVCTGIVLTRALNRTSSFIVNKIINYTSTWAGVKKEEDEVDENEA